MSTKTIALDSKIYARLASFKREGESFSKVIDRLLSEVANSNTGSDVLRGLAEFSPLPERDAELFLAVIQENRDTEDWERP
jgi:predicted CopG family antitoxin